MMTTNNPRAGIYIHIPFCVRKCIYCDFLSFPGCPETQIRSYFQALERECRVLQQLSEKSFQDILPADTLFIGGGTPSAVSPAYLSALIPLLPLTDDAEVTMEANPGTLNRERLEHYRAGGINRLSLGVQSFHDRELAFLGRIHDCREAIRSFREARAAGFRNISLDLIFGFPGQTLRSWQETLRTAVELEPEHLSFYSLQIEEGTPLYRMFREDQVEQIPDELNREMYYEALRVLSEAGYEHYEISNAARPGRRCRHNMKYWTMAPYFGLGAGAHSFVQGTRYAAPDTVEEYQDLTTKMEQSGEYFTVRGGALSVSSPADLMSDFMFTGLRLTEGISIREFERRFEVNFREYYREALDRHLEDGTMVLKDGFLRFTEKGLDVSNYILIDFI